MQTRISADRVNAFLGEEEVPAFVSSLKQSEDEISDPNITEANLRIGIRNGSFVWNEGKSENKKASPSPQKSGNPWWKVWRRRAAASGSSEATLITSPVEETRRFELRDINIDFPVGKLTVVTGPTASGKTALLMALLGEMTSTAQDLFHDDEAPTIFLPKHPSQFEASTGLRNQVSYAAQHPWLEHASIRDNILFGSPYEEERYTQVVECCALKPDFDILEDGDETEIGERGVSLSGGQKAR